MFDSFLLKVRSDRQNICVKFKRQMFVKILPKFWSLVIR